MRKKQTSLILPDSVQACLGQQESSCTKCLPFTGKVRWSRGWPGALLPLTQARNYLFLHSREGTLPFPVVAVHGLPFPQEMGKKMALVYFICVFLSQDQTVTAVGAWKIIIRVLDAVTSIWKAPGLGAAVRQH